MSDFHNQVKAYADKNIQNYFQPSRPVLTKEQQQEKIFLAKSAIQCGVDSVQLYRAKQQTLKGGDPLSIRFRCGQIADIINGDVIPRELDR